MSVCPRTSTAHRDSRCGPDGYASAFVSSAKREPPQRPTRTSCNLDRDADRAAVVERDHVGDQHADADVRSRDAHYRSG